MILKRDDAFTVVCKLKTPKEDGSYVVGTGIFVTSPAGNDNVFLWIVTANHVAKETNEKTQPTTSNIQFLNGRKFLPMDHFNLKQESVSRNFELTCIGFPRGLGTEGLFSPFTFRSFASSGFFRYPRFDTKQECIFFCLENPSVGGYSGGPILNLGYSTNGVFEIKKEKTLCLGIMHGTMCDDTGGKIAMVTPAFYLKDIIGGV